MSLTSNIMSVVKTEYSTKRISKTLLAEIKDSLKSIKNFGSVELYVQNNVVTQITTRNIKKTNKPSVN